MHMRVAEYLAVLIGDGAGRGVFEPGCWVEARLIGRDWMEDRLFVLLADGLHQLYNY
jgi:hypothetical protein